MNPASGNFAAALNQVQGNLPNSPNPSSATGLDQIPLLIFGACTDVKPATYSVNTSLSVASNMTNLVNAGVQMVNQHIGGLAATGTPLNQQVSAIFTQLVNADTTAGASTATTFLSICMAANSFGVGMTGF